MLDPLTRKVLAKACDKQNAEFYDYAAHKMAEHCDKRIDHARKAVNREEKYLRKLLNSRSAGGVMAGDIEGAFHRIRTDLDKSPKLRK